MRSTAKLLVLLKTGYQRILKDNLVGIYLHGSFVLGSFNEAISDLDYLVVTYKPLSLVE
ncbi:nucleotidyltransferase domain-containing protein [Liquorilactobacillus hordei]|nr:nucleotidyltransferase domain-containing protein [Liquorilactobacillus hordei]